MTVSRETLLAVVAAAAYGLSLDQRDTLRKWAATATEFNGTFTTEPGCPLKQTGLRPPGTYVSATQIEFTSRFDAALWTGWGIDLPTATPSTVVKVVD